MLKIPQALDLTLHSSSFHFHYYCISRIGVSLHIYFRLLVLSVFQEPDFSTLRNFEIGKAANSNHTKIAVHLLLLPSDTTSLFAVIAPSYYFNIFSFL